MDKSLSNYVWYISVYYNRWSLSRKIFYVLFIIQYFYYPILAIVGVPVNVVTVYVLLNKDCGLSPCVRRYLGAMAVADLLVIILDLILRHIPIVYREEFDFLRYIPVCNIHAVLLYAATDCSVWFTVSFTFDRFVAICCQKLKSKYCSEKTAAVVLGTVTVLSCLKNMFWYFMLGVRYWMGNSPWFCYATVGVEFSRVWGTVEFLHYILTPALPFLLILPLVFSAVSTELSALHVQTLSTYEAVSTEFSALPVQPLATYEAVSTGFCALPVQPLATYEAVSTGFCALPVQPLATYEAVSTGFSALPMQPLATSEVVSRELSALPIQPLVTYEAVSAEFSALPVQPLGSYEAVSTGTYLHHVEFYFN
ncbi:uncharacterized protein LOC132209180 [Stegostoma tigrinum]|uniref:uncharacterized protein LOC132209180 n=1 Tax=Stegostoma tigrinum TaxID=3053191 RepID=UPI0028709904|nr:uncharacterized protein LOC132209180 [Stegostoma tigrinum]